MYGKRHFLKTLLDGVWSTPIVVSIVLPAHASMSGMNFRFNMSFTENCMDCNTNQSDGNGDMKTIDPPLDEELVFEIFTGEIESGEFTKTFDLNGDGPISDFFPINFQSLTLRH